MGLKINKLLIIIGLLCIVATSLLLVYAIKTVDRITIDVVANENNLRTDPIWNSLNGISDMAYGINKAGGEYLCMGQTDSAWLESGIYIVNVSVDDDPTAITNFSSGSTNCQGHCDEMYDTATFATRTIRNAYADDEFCFAVIGDAKHARSLLVINVTDFANITVIANVSNNTDSDIGEWDGGTGFGWATKIDIEENGGGVYAYITRPSRDGGSPTSLIGNMSITIINITDPLNPDGLAIWPINGTHGFIQADGSTRARVYDIRVLNNITYLSLDESLVLVNVTSPEAPQFISNITIDGQSLQNSELEVVSDALAGTFAYITNLNTGYKFHIYNVTDTSNPTFGVNLTSDFTTVTPRDIIKSNDFNYTYVISDVGGTNRLDILNHSDPSNLSILMAFSSTEDTEWDTLCQIFSRMSNHSLNNFYCGGRYATDDYEDLFIFRLTVSTIPVTLETPADNLVITTDSQDFRCSGRSTTSSNIDNVTFFLWDSADAIEATTFRDLTDAATQNESFSIPSIKDDAFKWNCEYTDVNNEKGTAPSNFTITIDTIAPTIDMAIVTNLSSTQGFQVNYTFNDTNPQACWYTIDGGATNNTFSACGSNASILANNGDNVLFTYINDTGGNEASDNENFTVVNLTAEFNATNVLETSIQNFAVELINSSARMISGVFTYNDTEQNFDTFTTNGSSVFVNTSVTLGLFDLLQTNQTFWWNLTFQRGDDRVNISTPQRIQDVRQMFIGNCTDGISTTTTLNFTIFEEGTSTEINATEIAAEIKVWNRTEDLSRTFNFQIASNSSRITNTSRFAFCILPTFLNTSSNIFIQYGHDGFSTREFHRDNGLIDSTTQQINLYLADSDDTDAVTINVEDENGNELEDVVVEAHLKDISTGNFSIADTQSTNPDGVAVFNLVRGDNFYKFLFRIDGVLELETGEFKLAETEYFFVITIGPPSVIDTLVELDSIIHSLTFNASGCNLFVFTWDDTDDIADSFRLLVSNITTQNGTLSSLSQSSTNQTGTLIYNLTTPSNTCTPVNGTYLAQGFVTTTEDSDEHLLDSLTVIFRKIEEVMPAVGTRDAALFALIVVLTLFGVGMVSQNPSIYIGLGLVGMWVMTIINFLSLGTATIVTLAVVGMFYIWRLKT